ncbi:MAG: DUF2846 domain-containing protein [Taibaiella sp.]|nr:DUF2846 domain-containing protein [Taibaiella sp.]
MLKPIHRYAQYYKCVMILILLFSTSFANAQPPLNENAEVIVLSTAASAPVGATKVGTIKVVDKGFKIDCGYDRTIQQAKEKARKIGGNILKITKLKEPSMVSSCYNLHADVYYIDDFSKLKNQVDSYTYKLKHLIPENAKYALLYFYRPANYTGAIISYNIHLNDSTIGRIANRTKFSIKVYKQGPATIWTRTEARKEIHPDIQFGKAYFIKCGIKMGIVVGQPDMYIIDPRQGIEEYDNVDDRDHSSE